MKLKNRKRFFIHAPAFYGNKDAETGEFVSRRFAQFKTHLMMRRSLGVAISIISGGSF